MRTIFLLDSFMKKALGLLVLLTVLLAGCAQRYTLITGNGNRITAFGKPQYKDGVYVYKDEQGHEQIIPAGRVREIAPSSEAKTTDFTPGSSK